MLICLVNGVLTLIGLIIIGVPFAFTLGLTAMIFSLIPIFGTILSYIFLRELITFKVLISLTAVVVGIYFVKKSTTSKIT